MDRHDQKNNALGEREMEGRGNWMGTKAGHGPTQVNKPVIFHRAVAHQPPIFDGEAI